MTIKNLKSVDYLIESTFAEPYVHGTARKEIKISELETEMPGEKLETKYLNKTRELNNTTATGRKTGKLTFKKPLDGALLAEHVELVGAGLGTVTSGVDLGTISAKATAANIVTLTVADASLVDIGDIVFVQDANGRAVLSMNRVMDNTGATATEIELEYPVSDEQYAWITATSDKLLSAETVKVSTPDNSNTFQFVVSYDDSTCEVFRGCGIQMQFELTNSGLTEISFEVMAAIAEDKDEFTKVLHTQPSGSITAEGTYQPIFINFQQTYLLDTSIVTPVNLENNPQELKLNFGHILKPKLHMGGSNNITGWYTEPSVTCTGGFDRTDKNLELFDKDLESAANQFMFMSQKNFCFFAPAARYTNSDKKYYNEFDIIEVNVDVNHDTIEEPLLILPQ